MNALLNEKYVATKGLDNALKVAKVLIEQDYQVMIQLDDFDIYIVSFADNDLSLGAARFALISEAEEELLIGNRDPEPDDWSEDLEPADSDDTNRF